MGSLIVALACFSLANAQSDTGALPPQSTTADLAFDIRARIAESERFTSRLQSSYFFVRSDQVLGAGQFINLSVIDQYKALRWYEASFETEIRRRSRAPADRSLNVSTAQLKTGLIRIPFGIYNYRETYDSGLINYPLARSDYAYDAVDWTVPGAQVTGTAGAVQVETAVFDGTAAGLWGNYNGVDGATTRLQFYAPPNVIVGISGWDGHQAPNPTPGQRKQVALGGLDLRYSQSHLIVRGEALAGTLAGDTTRGFYLDVYYRLPGIETLSLVGRVESLKPATSQPQARQTTAGVRWNLGPNWTFSTNYQTNNIRNAYGFTWTKPSPGKGALLFQLLRRFELR